MTDVYVTRTGSKYHAAYDCPGLTDAEAKQGRPIERWMVALRGLSQEPCLVCWPLTGAWDAWAQLAHEVERTGDSPYEAYFVTQVLRHVRGLRPSDVLTQQQAEGFHGKRYRLDFVLQTAGGQRVAVEIDGKDKAPSKTSVEDEQRKVEARRADLRAAGWRVLNLSNNRVVNHSAECVTEVEAELHDALSPMGQYAGSTGAPISEVQDRDPRAPSARSVGKWLAAVLIAVAVVGGPIWWAMVASDSSQQDVAPEGKSCPSSAPVKGNINDSGEKIYHRPGWQYYDVTWPEKCFATGTEAEEAGYRRSEVR